MSSDGQLHLDRRISIGHLITTGVLLVTVLQWGITLQARVESSDRSLTDARERLLADVAREAAARERGEASAALHLERIEAKLDRALELARGCTPQPMPRSLLDSKRPADQLAEEAARPLP